MLGGWGRRSSEDGVSWAGLVTSGHKGGGGSEGDLKGACSMVLGC